MSTIYGTLSTVTGSVHNVTSLAIRDARALTASFDVDFESYSQFVFFGSAAHQVDVGIARILNRYPVLGSAVDIEKFHASSSQYQEHIYQKYPKFAGIAHFHENDQVTVNNYEASGTAGYIGTGSLTVGVAVSRIQSAAQKKIISHLTQSDNMGWSLTTTSGELEFTVVSGSFLKSVTHTPTIDSFYTHAVFSRNANEIAIYVDGVKKATKTVEPDFFGDINNIGGALEIASGSLADSFPAGFSNFGFSGSLDEIRIFNYARPLSEMSCSYNVNIFAQPGLTLYYRFNEGITGTSGFDQIVADYSGNENHGAFTSYAANNRTGEYVFTSNAKVVTTTDTVFDGLQLVAASSSLLNYEVPTPVMFVQNRQVVDFADALITSGTIYDSRNPNLITRLLPAHLVTDDIVRSVVSDYGNNASGSGITDHVLHLQDDQDFAQDAMRDFLFTIGQMFDEAKAAIDGMTALENDRLTGFNRIPAEMLSEMLRVNGIDTAFQFLTLSAEEQLYGIDATSCIEAPLTPVKVREEFLRRLYNAQPGIHKSKGTREALRKVLNVFGVDESLVRIKEYVVNPTQIGSGSLRMRDTKLIPYISSSQEWQAHFDNTGASEFFPQVNATDGFALEVIGHFPSTASIVTASIWNVELKSSGNPDPLLPRIYTTRMSSSLTSSYGKLHFTSGSESFSTPTIRLFGDDTYVHITHGRGGTEFLTGSEDYLTVHTVRRGEVERTAHVTGTYSATDSFFMRDTDELILGPVVNPAKIVLTSSEGYFHEVRVWEKSVSLQESFTHASNYKSFGSTNVTSSYELLSLHAQLYDTGSTIFDIVTGSQHTWQIPGKSSIAQYREIEYFPYGTSVGLLDTQFKTRIRNDIGDLTELDDEEQFGDVPLVTVEMNMVDELSEELLNLFVDFEDFNRTIGRPVMKWWADYSDLEEYRAIYFKRVGGARLRQAISFEYFMNAYRVIDATFSRLVSQLIPALANFSEIAFTIENHPLNRQKVQRRPAIFRPDGSTTFNDTYLAELDAGEDYLASSNVIEAVIETFFTVT